MPTEIRLASIGLNFTRLFLIALAAMAGAPAIAEDTRNVNEGVQRLGTGLQNWFNQEQRDRLLTVAAFNSDDGEQSAEFRRLLEHDLQSRDPKFEIRRSNLVLSGRLTKGKGKANSEDRFDSVALKVEARLNERGAEGNLQTFNISIFGDEALQILGPSAEFPKDLPEPEKQKKLDKQIGAASEAFISGSETLAAADGQFAVEILVREGSGSSGQPRRPNAVDGRAFVRLQQQEEYIVRLHNKSADETAIALTIDGLSMFAFAEDGTRDSMIIIPAGKSTDIPGWYITGKDTDVFEVANYAKSAAAAKGLPASGIGVVTARFHLSSPAVGKGEEATTRGRRIDQAYDQVRRAIGATRAFVTVRYNRDGQ